MLLFPIAAACTFAADQLIKKKVRKLDDEGRLPKTVLGGRVHLKRVENPGMIMGLGKDHPMLVKILPAAAVFVYVLLSWSRIRSAGALSRIGWGLLVGGAAKIITHLYKRLPQSVALAQQLQLTIINTIANGFSKTCLTIQACKRKIARIGHLLKFVAGGHL